MIKRVLNVTLIVLSLTGPALVGVLFSDYYHLRAGDDYIFIFASIVAPVVIAIIGTVIGLITRNERNAYKWQVVGFAIPAIIAIAYLFTYLLFQGIAE